MSLLLFVAVHIHGHIHFPFFQTFKAHPVVKLSQVDLEEMVTELNISPGTASDILIKQFLEKS